MPERAQQAAAECLGLLAALDPARMLPNVWPALPHHTPLLSLMLCSQFYLDVVFMCFDTFASTCLIVTRHKRKIIPSIASFKHTEYI